MSSDRIFDFVIVGGGSAGAVLARRLSENPDSKVLLLEAGPVYQPSEYPEVLASANRIGGDQNHDWGYTAEPGYIARTSKVRRAKVLGGCSAINATVAVRARPDDFSRWSKLHGVMGWSFEEVLETYKLLENAQFGEEKWHGRNGPLPIRQRSMDSITPALRAVIEAASTDIGLKRIDDFNAGEQQGVGPYLVNVVDGVRQNTGIAYLTDDVRKRSNLTIHGHSEVDRILIRGNRAEGVLLIDGTQALGKETILSAGAYGSPAILMRSGIGQKADLRALNIPLVVDLPVGCRLKEHPFYDTIHALPPNSRMEPATGAFLWTRSDEATLDELDLQVLATHLPPPYFTAARPFVVMSVAVTVPDSVGKVKLASSDPRAPPLIDLNLLAEPRDRRRMLEGAKLLRKIARAERFRIAVSEEISPGPNVQTDEQLINSIISSVRTMAHASCTAPMGGDNDPFAVVDSLGKVRGIEGLRVVDTSIFPEVPSTPTNVTVIMASEHIASRINQ